jgi:hypothetical protein
MQENGRMTLDARGLPVTTHSDAELVSIDWFTRRLARIDRGAEAILEDARPFPGSPMIQLAAASFCLFGQTRAADAAAADYLAAAKPLLASATEREQHLYHALSLWACKDHLSAVAAFEDISAKWPRDLLAAKIAEFIYYILGQQHEGARFRAHMQRLADANADDPDFLATYAFAQELCGDVDAARRTVDRALEIEPRNPWAHHCVAHIYLRHDEQHEGVRLLESFLPIWMSVGRVIHCHNAWHLGVASVAQLDRARALETFAHHVWGFTPDLVVEQALRSLCFGASKWQARRSPNIGPRWRIGPRLMLMNATCRSSMRISLLLWRGRAARPRSSNWRRVLMSGPGATMPRRFGAGRRSGGR